MKLILTVGLPRSGKSTWAKTTGYPIVNPDAIRLALHGKRFLALSEPWVWVIAYTMVAALFRAGNETVLVDATNVTEKRREEWKGRYQNVELKIFDTSPQECIRRARAEGDEEIVPIIKRMASEWDMAKPASWESQE